MARLCLTLPRRAAMTAVDHAELNLLETLVRGLPAAYILFHSVDWMSVHQGVDHRGELDIMVVNQGGDVLLVEVKAGAVDFRPDGISKSNSGRSKNVVAQVRRQHAALMDRLRAAGLSATEKVPARAAECARADWRSVTTLSWETSMTASDVMKQFLRKHTEGLLAAYEWLVRAIEVPDTKPCVPPMRYDVFMSKGHV